MTKTQDDYIKYRLERARKTFEDAKSLANLKSWNSSVNRLYYACFYAVLALFTKYELYSHTHSAVKTQLSLHFVKTGKLDKDFGMLYGDFFDLEEQHVTELIPKVEGFLKKIKSLIEE